MIAMHGRGIPIHVVLGPLTVTLASAAGMGAVAQPEDPTTASASQPPSSQPARIIVAPSAAPTLEPVRPNVPPPSMTDLELSSNPPLMREGAFVSAARAQIAKGKSGRWYAIFEPDGTGRRLPPMVLVETANLGAIERAAEREPGRPMRVTGRVTVYRDRNFLITTAPPIIERPLSTGSTPSAPPPPAPVSEPQARPAEAAGSTPPAPAPKSGSDPSVEQIIADLDRAVGTRRPAVASGDDSPVSPAPQPMAGMGAVVEPTESGVTSGFLAARKARVIRSSEGLPIAVLDNGTGGSTDSPMGLIPCQNLTAIESYAESMGESAVFTLTGEVFVYKGRRSLLPTMYTVTRPSDFVFPTH